MAADATDTPYARTPARFATTHWSVVLKAGQPDATGYRQALETLCRTYWFPIYAYLRRCGHNNHEAEEFTQAFFTRLLEKEYLRDVKPAPGRFRSFLLTALKRFLANEQDRAAAQKRGGGRRVLSLDSDDMERRYALDPVSDLSPDRLYERSWALAVLQRTMDRLEAEATTANKREFFGHLKVYLTAEGDSVPYREIAGRFRMSEGALRVAVHRLRSRYRQLLWDQIRQTVDTDQEVAEEIGSLFTALAR